MHAYKYCKLSTCLGHLQILVLGFCDNQRDEELIWKILSQVLSAALFMHVSGGISLPIMSHLVTNDTTFYMFCACSWSHQYDCHVPFCCGRQTSTACFVHGFEAISMTVMHHCVSDGATE